MVYGFVFFLFSVVFFIIKLALKGAAKVTDIAADAYRAVNHRTYNQYCSKCNAENKHDANFCTKCGEILKNYQELLTQKALKDLDKKLEEF